jgi:hypothetical protein
MFRKADLNSGAAFAPEIAANLAERESRWRAALAEAKTALAAGERRTPSGAPRRSQPSRKRRPRARRRDAAGQGVTKVDAPLSLTPDNADAIAQHALGRIRAETESLDWRCRRR